MDCLRRQIQVSDSSRYLLGRIDAIPVFEESLDQLRFLVVGIDSKLADCERQPEVAEHPVGDATQSELDPRALADVRDPSFASHWQ